MPDSPLALALRPFESAEANLEKLEKLAAEISALIPQGVEFKDSPEHEELCRAFEAILKALPAINGWKPTSTPADLDDIARWRFDAMEVGEIDAQVTVEREVEAPTRELREYRFRLNQARRALIRDTIIAVIDQVDDIIRTIRSEISTLKPHESITSHAWNSLKDKVDEIDALSGSSVQRPSRWTDLLRHLHFGMVGDFNDIEKWDWPAVKEGLRQSLYGEHEPIPAGITDLSELVQAKPRGPVTTKLKWSNLNDEEFERLIFSLIASEPSYENPEWLMKTNAPDRGRDLSVTRIITDPLSGTIRNRVIIQCRHRQKSSVAASDIATLKEQMSIWGDPRVNELIIATTGRFSADGVALIEKNNASDTALRIHMWPESHLERLLASRPAMIAGFRLR